MSSFTCPIWVSRCVTWRSGPSCALCIMELMNLRADFILKKTSGYFRDCNWESTCLSRFDAIPRVRQGRGVAVSRTRVLGSGLSRGGGGGRAAGQLDLRKPNEKRGNMVAGISVLNLLKKLTLSDKALFSAATVLEDEDCFPPRGSFTLS